MEDIEIRGLYKSYGENKVLKDLNAVFRGGETTCLMGRSGCGKTTLLNILMGIKNPDAGLIIGVAERIAAVFQEDRLLEDFTAAANVRLVMDSKATANEIRTILSALDLARSGGTPVRELSGGMRRRVAIARALAAEGDLYILDEPFKGLDGETKLKTIEYVRSRTSGKTVIIVTHDREEAELMNAGVLIMNGGRIEN